MRRALAVLGLVALAAGCSRGGGSSSPRGATSTTAGVVPVVIGPAVDLGQGVVVGVHPGLPIAYVSALDRAAGPVGCEGGDLSVLFTQPVDARGQRRRALPDRPTSGTVLAGGAEGAVAVVDQCEGFLRELGVGVPDSDGVVGAYRVVRPDTENIAGEVVPSSIRWAANGRSFIAVVKVVQPDDAASKQPDTIVRIGLDGSVATLASAIGVIAAAELGDGRLVRASNETVRVGDEPTTKVAVASLALAPDHERVAVFGDGGVYLLVPGSPLRRLTAAAATVGSWSPDGRLLAYLRLAGDGVAVDLLDVGTGEVVHVAPQGGFAVPVFSPDAASVLYSRPGAKDEIEAVARRVRP